ncbi:sulfurtransferase complex subunit TusC [Methylomonas sp. UP202]|uniref:sulfurtransferase complex subunit TusC n=1 Tax=Methylomonas sp. UP202 TaxID=3040943 RepID=UPI00247A6330|nr:sulfurtransferase complex subunit TusC [Methylomonas sp. UP202]WGS88182.1 sulfurtransferase complex subunit TusC [Methylomonas sp. UP202]
MAGSDFGRGPLFDVLIAMKKRYLFMLSQAPHCGNGVQEALDLILTTAAFDQTVDVLFVDDGVWQVVEGQRASGLGLKDTAGMFEALAFYGVSDVFVEHESLIERGVEVFVPIIPLKPLGRRDLPALFSGYDVVVGG